MPAIERPVVIDCHCHAGTGDGMTGPWDTAAPLDGYLRRAEAAGITRTVLLAAFNSDYRMANRAVARIVAGDPARFLGFAFVHPLHDRGGIASMIEESVRSWGFRGIKVHRHDGPLTREICDVARAWRLPVLYDVMGDVPPLELFATEYPQVAFVIPHLGSFADDWRAQRMFLDVLARHRNVFTDTSGVRRFDLLVEALQRAGAGKVLFGSDGPWLHPGVELAKVLALGLRPADRRRVLGGNLLGLLRRVRCPPRRQLDPPPAAMELPARADPWGRHAP